MLCSVQQRSQRSNDGPPEKSASTRSARGTVRSPSSSLPVLLGKTHSGLPRLRSNTGYGIRVCRRRVRVLS